MSSTSAKTRQKKYFFLQWWWVITLLAVFLTHTSFIDNGFTWLDHGDIEEGRAIVPLTRIWRAFTSRYGETGYYRPLVTVVHSVDYALYQLRPAGYHLTNVILHAGVSIAAAVFVRHFISTSSIEQLLTSLIVGVHAVSWWTVGTISNLQEILATLFTLLTLIFYFRVRSRGHVVDGVLACVCTAFAFLSKETALFWVPAVAVLWEFTSGKRLRAGKWVWVGGLILSGGYVMIRSRFVPELWKTPAVMLSLSEALGTRLSAVGRLLFHLVNPFKPAASDSTTIVGLTNATSLLTLFVIVFMIFVIVRSGIRHPVGRAFVLLAIALLPAFNILPLPRFTSTHYGYFAVPAVAMLAILLLRKLASQGLTLRGIGKLGVVIWLGVSSMATFISGFQFKNDLTMFTPEVTRDSNYREGYFYLGNYYFGKGEIEVAKKEYEAAMTVSSNSISFVDTRALKINLAGVYLVENRLDDAERLLKSAVKDAPTDLTAAISYNLALVSYKRGNYSAVVELLIKKEARSSRAASLLLVEALDKLGRSEEAKEVARYLTTN